MKNMNFEQFKREWKEMMVYTTIDFDFNNAIQDLYVEYSTSLNTYGKGMSVREWCEFFHADCDLDEYPYMIKTKALKTHHANGLKELANQFRKSVGEPLLPLIPLKNIAK